MKPILHIHPALQDDIRDLKTRRPLPNPILAHLDPFLFLNHHGPQVYRSKNDGLPFGPHPHRGFETVTFIFKGDVSHSDTAGHESVIKEGGVQWMTAGRGLIHSEASSEEFKRQGGDLEILQLWVNLPSRLKMTEPKYIGLQKKDIPQITLEKGKVIVNLISGSVKGQQGPIKSLTELTLMSLVLKDTAVFDYVIPPVERVLLYVVRGEVTVNGRRIKSAELVEFDFPGEAVTIEANMDSTLLFGHGLPFGEPIVSYGPFVMNTREEIQQAIKDVESGKIK